MRVMPPRGWFGAFASVVLLVGCAGAAGPPGVIHRSAAAAIGPYSGSVEIAFVGGTRRDSRSGDSPDLAPSHGSATEDAAPGGAGATGLVFVSGKIGADHSSFASEVSAAIDALEAELRAADLTLADVISTTVYLTDMQRFAEMNQVYAAHFPRPWPARTTIGAAALPGGASVEITAIAVRRPRASEPGRR
jgi:2-iminobutanoate/2-iminopropanoate deaminase